MGRFEGHTPLVSFGVLLGNFTALIGVNCPFLTSGHFKGPGRGPTSHPLTDSTVSLGPAGRGLSRTKGEDRG